MEEDWEMAAEAMKVGLVEEGWEAVLQNNRQVNFNGLPLQVTKCGSQHSDTSQVCMLQTQMTFCTVAEAVCMLVHSGHNTK